MVSQQLAVALEALIDGAVDLHGARGRVGHVAYRPHES